MVSRHCNIFLGIVLLLSCPFDVRSQDDAVDTFIKTNMESLRIPGLSLSIVRNNIVIKSGGYGFANLELSVPATSKTVYEIGSMTKQFTATAIMMLMEEGKLRLNDKITTFFPDAPSAWRKITIRHLLTHTSGIQNHVAVPGYLGVFKTNLLHETFPAQEEILKLFFKLPQEFKPGETWSYDNTGYYLLGLIIEKVSGKSYWQFLDEHIFKKLGMTASRNTDTKHIVPSRASGYIWADSFFQNQPVLWPFVGFSAGSIISTVADLALWDAALYTQKLVKKSSLEEMWKPALTDNGSLAPYNCGFGWFTDIYQGHRIVQHSGGTPGFSSVIYKFPDDTLTVIILTNHADRMIDQLAIDIAGMYVPALSRPNAIKDPSPVTSNRLKTIFSQLLHGNYNPVEFTAAMNTFLKTSTSKSLWQWFASFGKLGTFTLSDYEVKEAVTTLRYRVMLGENSYLFTFRTVKNGKIAQIYFS